MKSISNMLNRGNLTPRERFLLLVQSDVKKMKTGKGVLTEADQEALLNWHATTNEEAREWNQLNQGWQLSGRMDLEAELYFKDAQVAHLAQMPIHFSMLFYPADRRAGFAIDALKRIKKVTIDEAVAITQKQRKVKLDEGIDFDYAVYQLAIELLSNEDRKRINELYPDVETDHQYLDQEEIIAHLYNGKRELDDAAKDKLAELVAEQSYNRFAKEYQLFHYFACIPVAEVARHFLESRGVNVAGKALAKNQESDDEDSITHDAIDEAMHRYADKHGTNIKAMLREGCRRWLDHGLLDDYTPLVVSDDAELLGRWFKIKVQAKEQLLKHVQAGELALRDRTEMETRKEKLYSKGITQGELEAARKFFEGLNLERHPKGELDEKAAFETFSDKVVTGESLYASKIDYEFVKYFKERTDKYDANLGLVYADNDPEHKGDHLDQELLICDFMENGEPIPFSQYGLSTAVLSSIVKGRMLIEETHRDGTIFLKFKDDGIAKIFAERRQTVIESYARLLALKAAFEKLSPIYEATMTDHVAERLMVVRGCIEQHNHAIRTATNEDTDTKKQTWLLREKEPMRFEEDLTIDVDAIKPDRNILKEQEEKIKGIFPSIGALDTQ